MFVIGAKYSVQLKDGPNICEKYSVQLIDSPNICAKYSVQLIDGPNICASGRLLASKFNIHSTVSIWTAQM